MNFKSILTIFVLTLFTTIGNAHPGVNIEGRWRAVQPMVQPDVAYYVQFTFRPNSTQLSVNCAFRNGTNLIAMAKTRSSIDNFRNEIYIQQPNEGISSDGFRYCRATLQPARWLYDFDHFGRLQLTIATPYPQRFTLVRM